MSLAQGEADERRVVFLFNRKDVNWVNIRCVLLSIIAF